MIDMFLMHTCPTRRELDVKNRCPAENTVILFISSFVLFGPGVRYSRRGPEPACELHAPAVVKRDIFGGRCHYCKLEACGWNSTLTDARGCRAHGISMSETHSFDLEWLKTDPSCKPPQHVCPTFFKARLVKPVAAKAKDELAFEASASATRLVKLAEHILQNACSCREFLRSALHIRGVPG